jgi:hypothetical protein
LRRLEIKEFRNNLEVHIVDVGALDLGQEERKRLISGWEQLYSLNKFLPRAMEWALNKWTKLDTWDYAGLLKSNGDYTVTELHIKEGDWLGGQTPGEIKPISMQKRFRNIKK